MGVIYCYTNLINGKKYFGQTISEKTRYILHKSNAFNENSPEYNSVFHRAIRKYGWDNFKYEIVATSDDIEILNLLEIMYIKKYNTKVPNGYNVETGGKNCERPPTDAQKEKLRWSHAALTEKEVIELPKKELGFSYRTSILQSKPYILLDTEFELKKGNKEEIKQTILNNREFRKAHQPQALPNVGSIFRNPEGDSAGRMLDEIGAKSFKIGGAKVFENHANFIINDNNATSTDVLELMLMMYNKVKEKYNVKLRPEVKYFGKQTDREKEICTILFQK